MSATYVIMPTIFFCKLDGTPVFYENQPWNDPPRISGDDVSRKPVIGLVLNEDAQNLPGFVGFKEYWKKI